MVPAYNEAARIAPVLDTLTRAPSVDAVIVVDDGSHDGTADAAGAHPAVATGALTVLRQPQNRGKGAAMRAGAEAADDADALLFLDADLIGLTIEHVESLVEPVRTGRVDMALGVFRGGNFWTTLAQIIVPNISGQRAIRRDLFLEVPQVAEARYGVELAITNYVIGEGRPMAQVMLKDVSHPPKERKLGFWRGLASRARMYQQMLPYMLRRYRRRRPH